MIPLPWRDASVVLVPGRLTPRRLVQDVVLALLSFVVSAGAAAGDGWGEERRRDGDHDLEPLGLGLVVAMCLPLAARRLAAYPVLAAVTTATTTLYALDYGFPPIAFVVALYTVVRWCPPSRLRSGAIWLSLATLLVPPLALDGIGPESFGAFVAWTIALLVGEQVRQRRVRADEAEARSRESERTAERERRLASAEERTRIARDLHDSAGHAVNVILVQAGAARVLLEQDPARSREALETIEDVARETLVEIDRLVHALRETGASEPVEPPAGLAALETLVERTRAAGLDVAVTVSGERRRLAPGVDQAAYRILREALTNAARHGTGGAQLAIDYAETTLELAVTNPVATERREAPIGGHGLVGMRERATLLGGTFETRTSDGTFRLEVSLPYREPS